MSAESDYDGDEHGGSRRNKSDRKRAPSSPGNKADRGGNNSSSSSLLGLKKTDSQGNEIIEDHENTDGKGSGRANGGSGSGNDDGGDKPETGRTGSTGNDHQGDEEGSTSGLDPEEKEKRDREERIAASLKRREEEVAKDLSGHLHARDKEREQHRRAEAVSAFQALLTDLIKHPDFSWKEAKKIFKKDSRYVILRYHYFDDFCGFYSKVGSIYESRVRGRFSLSGLSDRPYQTSCLLIERGKEIL